MTAKPQKTEKKRNFEAIVNCKMESKAAKSVKSGKVQVDKFEKEATKFFKWAQKACVLVTKEKERVEWDKKLLQDFEKPSQKGMQQLDAFVKHIMREYTILMDEIEVDDASIVLDMYKESGRKRKRTESDELADVVVDDDLDTSGTYYLDTLDLTTEELVAKLGTPLQAEGKKHMHEWKVKVGKSVYSVYDWQLEDGEFESFESATWHIAGKKANKAEVRMFVEFVKAGQQAKHSKLEHLEDDCREDVDDAYTPENLFGSDSEDDELDLEINLDDIELE